MFREIVNSVSGFDVKGQWQINILTLIQRAYDAGH